MDNAIFIRQKLDLHKKLLLALSIVVCILFLSNIYLLQFVKSSQSDAIDAVQRYAESLEKRLVSLSKDNDVSSVIDTRIKRFWHEMELAQLDWRKELEAANELFSKFNNEDKLFSSVELSNKNGIAVANGNNDVSYSSNSAFESHEDSYSLKWSLPKFVTKNDIKIDVKNSMMTILVSHDSVENTTPTTSEVVEKTERKDDKHSEKNEDASVALSSLKFKFSRMWSLPYDCDINAIKAKLESEGEHVVLLITMPKRDVVESSKSIEIE